MRPRHFIPSCGFGRGPSPRRAAGFTLAEAIITIVITGILAGIVAVFIQRPVQGYFDATRRGELSDIADTALRRMTRDLRLALPNSVRVTSLSATQYYLEFLISKGGGRYRAEVTSTGTGDILEFGTVSGAYTFDVIGRMPSLTTGADSIVVYNLGSGFAGADAYQAAGNNRRLVTAVSGNTITLAPGTVFPQESPGNRFQVMETVVSYVCTANTTNPALGELRRYWGYSIQPTQPTTFTGGSNALLAKDVTGCLFTYTPNAVAQRNGVVLLSLTLTQAAPGGNESVTLFQEAHVSNVP